MEKASRASPAPIPMSLKEEITKAIVLSCLPRSGQVPKDSFLACCWYCSHAQGHCKGSGMGVPCNTEQPSFSTKGEEGWKKKRQEEDNWGSGECRWWQETSGKVGRWRRCENCLPRDIKKQRRTAGRSFLQEGGCKPGGVKEGVKELTEHGNLKEETLTPFAFGSGQHVCLCQTLGAHCARLVPFCVTSVRQRGFSARDGAAMWDKLPSPGTF